MYVAYDIDTVHVYLYTTTGWMVCNLCSTSRARAHPDDMVIFAHITFYADATRYRTHYSDRIYVKRFIIIFALIIVSFFHSFLFFFFFVRPHSFACAHSSNCAHIPAAPTPLSLRIRSESVFSAGDRQSSI